MNRFTVKTTQRIGLYDITDKVKKAVKGYAISDGVAVIYVPHTTAAVIINENYDPGVVEDINDTLARLIPANESYHHTEGNADAHIKAAIIGSSRTVIITNGSISLGRWQGIFLCEFDGPREREVWLTIHNRRKDA
ncbi:MAG TPA: YjbQ family protein [bacterium (Candidatus Stahlbacteria)]|nr:YjbQ family protein [Candidatus Stahlbacteria bacterium]